MTSRHCVPACWLMGFFLYGMTFLAAHAQLAETARIKYLRNQAERFERQGDWERACESYDALLQIDRNLPDIRQRYQHCLRRYLQVRRHRDDPSYRKEVLGLGYPQAVKLYQLVLGGLIEGASERGSATPEQLFKKGLEEFSHALADPVFLREHLAGISPGEIRSFRSSLQGNWGKRSVDTIEQAVHLVRDVAMSALRRIKLPATVTVMEFTCGCCYAFDDYTLYLSPAQLRELCESLKGEFVGVGLRLGLSEGRIVITEVLPGTSAADIMPPLNKGDVLAQVDRKPTRDLTLEAVTELLQGENGSWVELVIDSPTQGERMITLRRRPIFGPSVFYQPRAKGIGYLAITTFQESTPHEVDAALVALGKETRALVLDLRGNSGGSFEAAIDTARRFLPSGTIVTTLTSDPQERTVYQSRNPAAVSLPLIVLIDGDTASAAEVLAGALKENKRARLLGQTTFGKGCIQSIIRLSPQPGVVYPGGLRITVARFLSPNGTPYSGRGVVPDRVLPPVVKPDTLTASDPYLDEALLEAQRLVDTLR